MSSIPLFSSAEGKPIVSDPGKRFGGERILAHPKLAQVTLASRLEVRPMPEMVSSGVREMDAVTGGLPRGCLIEICGAASSGRTSMLLAALAAATRRQETCALVDATEAFDPDSAAKAGVAFERLLWVRCGKHVQKLNSPQRLPSTSLRTGSATENGKYQKEGSVEQALRVTDLLLQSVGFGLVVVDLGDVPFALARRIPLTSWFRFQRAVEHTPTVLMVITQAPCARTCASLLVQMKERSWVIGSSSFAKPAHVELLDELRIEGELLRSRLERKPVRSVMAGITTKAVRISA